MDTTEFERLLQEYLRIVNADDRSPDDDYLARLDMAAYKALEEAAGLLGVSMLVQR